MQKDIKTVAGCFTNVTCNVTATDGREVELAAYIAIGQERRPVPKRGKNIFVFPAVEYGQHLYEIRADGKPLIFGFLLVRPSAFPVAEGTVDYTLNATLDSIDALHVDIELPPGPRGWSAYEIAVQEGFEGTESEWLEHMRQQTATLAVERVTPLMERAETAADKSENEAAAAKTEQEAATAAKTDAEAAKLAAQTSERNAKASADAAAADKTAAAKSAQAALANQQGAEQAAQDAVQAQEAATAAKTDAEAAKLAAQTSERNAKASADAAAADKTAAAKSAQDALAAQGKAEQEAQKAADNAALLGDAALKSGDNVFSGANVFNGALSGSGTLCGLPFGSAFGLANALQGVSLSPEEFFMLFPDHKNMEVWPWLDNPTATIKAADMPKLKHVFMCLQRGHYVAPPDLPLNEYGEMVIYHSGNGWIQAGIRAYWARNILVFPEYNNCSYGHYINIRVGNAKTVPEIILYMPKNGGIQFSWEWYLSSGAKIVFLGSQVYKSIKGFNSQGRCEIPVTIKGFNSPNCELVFLPWAGLDKESILELVGSLPAYDAETMTEVPSCTLYVRPEYEGDEEIREALLGLQTAVEDGGKGWTLAVNGATLTPAATFGLRRFMYLLRSRCDSGDYVDAEGFRWDVRGGQTVLRNYVANEQLGYEAFATLEDALGQWGLTEYQPEESKAD